MKDFIEILLLLAEIVMFIILFWTFFNRKKMSKKIKIAQSLSMSGILLLTIYWAGAGCIIFPVWVIIFITIGTILNLSPWLKHISRGK